MTPDEIREQLANPWLVMRDDRRRLERQLARLTAAQPTAWTAPLPQPVPVAAPPSGRYEHIAIDGDAEFMAATRRALHLIRRVPSWSVAAHLTCIRQLAEPSDTDGGYCSGTTFYVRPATWQGDATAYAGSMAHEGTHAARGCAVGTEEERAAFRAEAQALREMGAGALARAADREAARPTHHIAGLRAWGLDEHGRPLACVVKSLVTQRRPSPQRERRASARPGWLRVLIGLDR